LGLLTILFVGLKLTGYIAWSWWWVLAPIWVPFAIGMGALLIVVAGMLVRRARRNARLRANKPQNICASCRRPLKGSYRYLYYPRLNANVHPTDECMSNVKGEDMRSHTMQMRNVGK
jgi:hypothetical protein